MQPGEPQQRSCGCEQPRRSADPFGREQRTRRASRSWSSIPTGRSRCRPPQPLRPRRHRPHPLIHRTTVAGGRRNTPLLRRDRCFRRQVSRRSRSPLPSQQRRRLKPLSRRHPKRQPRRWRPVSRPRLSCQRLSRQRLSSQRLSCQRLSRPCLSRLCLNRLRLRWQRRSRQRPSRQRPQQPSFRASPPPKRLRQDPRNRRNLRNLRSRCDRPLLTTPRRSAATPGSPSSPPIAVTSGPPPGFEAR